MKTFGKSNSMQSSSQTGDDNLEVSANLLVKGTASREGFGLCWYAWMNLGLDSQVLNILEASLTINKKNNCLRLMRQGRRWLTFTPFLFIKNKQGGNAAQCPSSQV